MLFNSRLGRDRGGDVGDGLPGLVLHLVVVGVVGVDSQGVGDGLLMPSAGDGLPVHGLSSHTLLLLATHRGLGARLAGDLLEGDCLVTDIRVWFSKFSGINLLRFCGEDTDKKGYSSRDTGISKLVF